MEMMTSPVNNGDTRRRFMLQLQPRSTLSDLDYLEDVLAMSRDYYERHLTGHLGGPSDDGRSRSATDAGSTQWIQQQCPRGLRNVELICYLNSAIQCLIHSSFATDICSVHPSECSPA